MKCNVKDDWLMVQSSMEKRYASNTMCIVAKRNVVIIKVLDKLKSHNL